MYKIFFFVIGFGLLLSSCNNSADVKNNQGNHLIQENVSVLSEFMRDTLTGWQQYKDIEGFFIGLFKGIEEGKIKAFSPNAENLSLTLTPDDFFQRLVSGLNPDSLPESRNREYWKYLANDGLRSFFFDEIWSFDTLTWAFTKQIKAWCPVRYYLNENNAEQKMLLAGFPGSDNAEVLLGANIVSEFSMTDTVTSFAVQTNMENLRLARLIIGKAMNSKVQAYDPGDTSKVYTRSELIERVVPGNTLPEDSVIVAWDEFSSVIFVEDWYFNPTDYSMKKVVKAVGPVRHFYRDDQLEKKVLFLIGFNNNRIKIF